MTIQFECPSCGNSIRVRDESAGRIGTCNRCRERLEIPARLLPPPVFVSTPDVESPSGPQVAATAPDAAQFPIVIDTGQSSAHRRRSRSASADGTFAGWMIGLNLVIYLLIVALIGANSRAPWPALCIALLVAGIGSILGTILGLAVGAAFLRLACWLSNRCGALWRAQRPNVVEPSFYRAMDIVAVVNFVQLPVYLVCLGFTRGDFSVALGMCVIFGLPVFVIVLHSMLETDRFWKTMLVVGCYFVSAASIASVLGLAIATVLFLV